MIGFYLNKISRDAILFYVMAISLCIILYIDYLSEWYIYIYGFVEIFLFFYCGTYLFKKIYKEKERFFIKDIFLLALVIRVCYVFYSYHFYITYAGSPFEFGRYKDSLHYYQIAEMFYKQDMLDAFKGIVMYFQGNISDSGYALYLVIINKLFGSPQIIIPRLLHALYSSLICVLVYKIGNRHFGEITAKLAAVFCVFMPNLIFYCGLHNKEIVMTFLVLLYIERADKLLIHRSLSVFSWLCVLLIAFILFTFRTVLGVCALLALLMALFFSSERLIGWGRRIVIMIMGVLVVWFLFSDKIVYEIKQITDQSIIESQRANMEWRSTRGTTPNDYVKYVGAGVFAPLIFTIPFPSVVYTADQTNQRLIHGGNYIKNIMSFFVIAIMINLLHSGEWRNHVLLISFYLGYLLVLAFSSFAHSERFHLPIIPFMLLFAAVGVVRGRSRWKKWSNIWIYFMLIVFIGWNWFKLSGRGLI